MSSVQIMAILNLTPDSFSDGGRLSSQESLLQAAETALKAGADILDMGGESTRPGARCVPEQEELSRVIPAIEAVRQTFPNASISVDTRKATVAQAALRAGATMVNDVSGLQYDPAMAEVCAGANCPVILTHSQGTPETMQHNPSYPQGVITEVASFFERQIQYAHKAGVRQASIILDPGFGFGKTLAQNLELLNHLDALMTLGCPLMVGTSRKTFLTLGVTDIPPEEREALSALSMAFAIERGARYVRVHNPKLQAPAVRLIEATLKAGPSRLDCKRNALMDTLLSQ
ncbi:dihydropteroate synthase [Vampirovibrio sp.]|uniref:dihydropteroate synthase n=1 Tax=Vampirovibrio sp. TaxID=2717857 RepID=UPI003594941F